MVVKTDFKRGSGRVIWGRVRRVPRLQKAPLVLPHHQSGGLKHGDFLLCEI